MKIYLCLTALLGAATAQEILKLEQSIVTNQEQSHSWDLVEYQSKLPTKSVSRINQEQILQSSSGTGGVQSILENVPGITYSRASGVGGQISIRGMNSNNTRSIIAVDGVRVAGRSTLEFSTLDLNSIDSIEIIRGAASSIYGASAINGVINFKTRRYWGDIDAPFSMDAKIRALEYTSVNQGIKGRVELLGGGDGFDVLIGLNGAQAGDFRTPEGVAEHSNYDYVGGDFTIGYTHNSIRYYLQGKYQRVRSSEASNIFNRPGSSYGLLMEENPLTELYLKAGAEIYHQTVFADTIESFLYWRQYNTDIYIDTRNLVNYGGSGILRHRKVYHSNYIGGKIHMNKLALAHNISYGIDTFSAISPTQVTDINRLTNTETKNSRNSAQISIAPYIKDDWTLNDSWILSGSLRYDYQIMRIGKKRSTSERNDTTGQTTRFLDANSRISSGALTGNLGAAYFLNEDLSFVTNVSENFKSQGTIGMFPNYGGTIETLANLDLKPERAQSYEIGMRFHNDNHYISLTLYRTNYMDMIALKRITPTTQQYQNIGRAYIQGAELESNHHYHQWMLSLNAAYTYGQDKSANKPLPYIPPLTGRISLSYHFPWGYTKWMQRGYLGKTRIQPTQERKTRSYTMSDVFIGVDLRYFSKELKDMEMIFGIENLFNAKGRNPATIENINYPIALTNPLLEPGTNAFLKFAYRY